MIAHRTDRLGHLGHHHDDGETAATEGGDGELIVDVAELRLGVEDTHVEELGEDLALHAGPKRVLCGQQRDAVGEGPQRAAELVVSGVRGGERAGAWARGGDGHTCGSLPGPGCGTCA